jgi:diguanylate cyclase (GGDEF)-like protein
VRPWAVYAGVGAAVTGAYAVLPRAVQTWVYLVVGIFSVGCLVAGIRRHRPERPLPWWLLALGIASFVVGDAVYAGYDLTGSVTPFPSVADGIYALSYPLLLVALTIAVRRSGARDHAAWLDAGIWSLGALCALWLPLLGPFARDTDLDVLARAVALAFPVMDLLLLLLLINLVLGRGRPPVSYQLLAVGLLLLGVSDVLYGSRSLAGAYHSGELTDLGWLVSYLCVGAAALHPTMTAFSTPLPSRPGRPSQARLLFLVLPALVPPGLLIGLLLDGHLRGDVAGGLVVAASLSVLLLLSTVRVSGLISEMQEVADRLRQRETGLEAALRERELLAEELRSRATSCALTGLVNRAGFVDLVSSALDSAEPLTVGLLDLDDFKSVNDTLGHDAGDALLVLVAGRLRDAVGPRDVVGRFGGDEFALLLRGDATETADRVVEALGAPVLLEGHELRVEASLGMVDRSDRSSIGDLLRRADVAMYAAKAAGGNRWAGYEAEMSASLLRRLDLRSQLVRALERDEIEAWYQPVVDLGTGALLGFEALARWARPGRPVQAPGEWIGLAEDTGLVVPIDLVILRKAVREAVRWRALAPHAELDLAVNASGRTLQEPGAATRVLALLDELGLPPSALVLEVTEGVLLEDEAVGRRLQMLRAAGVRIALDDFGTGWSSLAYLSRFPVDVLKLDRSFTAGLGQGAGGEAVPAAVVQLARALDLEVVAEGVETVEQQLRLQELGARCAQGYLFGRPASADTTRRLVVEGLTRGVPVAAPLLP